MSALVATGYVLWCRLGRGHPWGMLGTYQSEREAWLNAAGRGSVDYCVLPAGREP